MIEIVNRRRRGIYVCKRPLKAKIAQKVMIKRKCSIRFAYGHELVKHHDTMHPEKLHAALN